MAHHEDLKRLSVEYHRQLESWTASHKGWLAALEDSEDTADAEDFDRANRLLREAHYAICGRFLTAWQFLAEGAPIDQALLHLRHEVGGSPIA